MNEDIIGFWVLYGVCVVAVFLFFGIIKLLKFMITNFWVSRVLSLLLGGFYTVIMVWPGAIVAHLDLEGWSGFIFLGFLAYLSILFFVGPVVFDTWESDDVEADGVSGDKITGHSQIHGGLILNSIEIIVFLVVIFVISGLLAEPTNGISAFLLPAIILIANIISIIVHVKNN